MFRLFPSMAAPGLLILALFRGIALSADNVYVIEVAPQSFDELSATIAAAGGRLIRQHPELGMASASSDSGPSSSALIPPVRIMRSPSTVPHIRLSGKGREG